MFCVTGTILWKRVNVSASFLRGRHCVTGTPLCDVVFRDVVAGVVFYDVAKVLLPRIAMTGTRKCDIT